MSNSLVSVIISTYNSSQYIIETLESVSKQTWREIELIITDDCSTDQTVDLCEKWIAANGNRYAGSTLIRSDNNTGISANANRGLRAAKGEWIKFLGADDTLMPDCLSDNMQFLANNPEARVLFSRVNVYRDTFEERNFIKTTPMSGENKQNSIIWTGRSAESQYKMLLSGDRIHFTPSVFIQREILLKVGGFDERFRMMEDYPLWLNLTKNGHKLYFMDKTTVNYRRHLKALNNTGLDYIVNPNYFKQEVFRKIYTYPYLPITIRYNQRFIWYVSQIFRSNWLNKKKKPNMIIWKMMTIYLNPFKYLLWFNNLFMKNLKDPEFYP